MENVNCRLYSLWLDDDVIRIMKIIAATDDVSVASLIRSLLNVYIDKRITKK